MGLEIKGVGLIIQEWYVRHTVKCNGAGKISREYKYD